ncbi:MAG: hypothetical protein AUF76_10190 [Acidobacteria bacterium 13_1_20CM_2_65_9]|nr:MAG: hypothetical protein AUF76_10190 [Acidobacteria bacterium 13_1_20CM_2_65_9]
MMIPGQWEPRRSNPVAVNAPAPMPAVGREPERTKQLSQASRGRREMATWLEVTIVTVALLAAMVLAMWASRFEPRVVLRHDASARSPHPLSLSMRAKSAASAAACASPVTVVAAGHRFGTMVKMIAGATNAMRS